MRKIETYGTVKEGKLKISYREKFTRAVAAMDDCRVKLTLEKLYRRRSTATIKDNGEEGRGQNGYYWSIIIQVYRDGAWETQRRMINALEAHNELKANCCYAERYNDQTGAIQRVILSTSTMNTVEFEEYCERCRAFIEEWYGRRVPLPNEQMEMELK